jgi:hypothetical protein
MRRDHIAVDVAQRWSTLSSGGPYNVLSLVEAMR